MNRSVEFLRLLGQTRRSGSALKQIRGLSHLWQFLSGLSKGARLELLAEIGMEEGEEVIDRFLRNPGSHGTELLRKTEALLAKVDPTRIRSLAEQHLGHEETKLLLGTLETVLTGPPPAPMEAKKAETPPAPTSREVAEATEPAPVEEVSNVSEPSAEAAPVTEGFEQDLARTKVAGEGEPEVKLTSQEIQRDVQSEADESVSSSPPSTAETPRDAAPAQPVHPPKPLRPSDDEVGSKERPAPGPQPAREVQASDTREDFETLLRVIQRIDSPLKRYRWLSRRLEQLRPVSSTLVGQILEQLPSAWMQRRCLTRLLETGLDQASIEGIIRLITEKCRHDVEYSWYASALIRSGQLTSQERELLVASAPKPWIRKRLERRVDRSHSHIRG
jgi:hypothetical protein